MHDAVERRPWIDWIHTARDQGALVRGYTKWDDQPASPIAAREAVLRANWIANSAPRGPTYVNLDAGMQESKLQEAVPEIDTKRFMPPLAGAAPTASVKQATDLLRNAKKPVILAGRTSRDVDAWNKRVALAERLREGGLTLLVFFPKDGTLVCTRQLCNYRDHLSIFEELEVGLVAINDEPLETHRAFAEKYKFPFPICSDPERRVCHAYDALLELTPSPVVALNRAVALSMALGPAVGLEAVDELASEPSLSSYHLLPSVRGDLLFKLGRRAEARREFERAASLTRNAREQALLLARATACDAPGSPLQ